MKYICLHIFFICWIFFFHVLFLCRQCRPLLIFQDRMNDIVRVKVILVTWHSRDKCCRRLDVNIYNTIKLHPVSISLLFIFFLFFFFFFLFFSFQPLSIVINRWPRARDSSAQPTEYMFSRKFTERKKRKKKYQKNNVGYIFFFLLIKKII